MNVLQGKVALVTGASKGIGEAIARELAARGAAVAVNYSRDRAAAEEVAAEIKAGGVNAIAVQGDVADEASVEKLVNTVADTLGSIDILVNNAGVYEFLPLEGVTPKHFHTQFDINVLGMLLVTRAAVTRFNPKGGSIINIGSLVGRMAAANGSVYSATKGAVDSITVSLSKELGARNIRVNAINPGLVNTDKLREVGITDSDFHKVHAENTPLGKGICEPRDIATSVAFLASEDSRWVSGQLIYLSGGLTR